MRARTLLLPLLTLLIATGDAAVSAETKDVRGELMAAGRGSLILDEKSALAIDKPIYDCACFDILSKNITRHWFPSKCQTNKVRVGFQITEAGDTTKIRLEHSSGNGYNDSAALKAVEKTKFDYIPLEHAKIVFNFDNEFRSSVLGPRLRSTVGATVVQIPDEAPPPLVYVESMYESAPGVLRDDYSAKIALNNEGVLELLKGHAATAADLFEQSSRSAPKYQPAIHNLAIARKLILKSANQP